MAFIWETPEEINMALAQRLSRIRKGKSFCCCAAKLFGQKHRFDFFEADDCSEFILKCRNLSVDIIKQISHMSCLQVVGFDPPNPAGIDSIASYRQKDNEYAPHICRFIAYIGNSDR
jgi:hypothetical protein